MNELSTTGVRDNPALSRADLADAVRSMGLLADLTISMWSGERSDAQVAAQVKAQAGAVGNTGRYIKTLLAGCDDTLKDLKGAYTSARTLHYKLTLPWVANPHAERQVGPRLLPNLLFQRYIVEVGKLRNAANAKRDAFIADYPNLIQRAMANLAGLARVEDYPTPDEVKRAFRFEFDFAPIPPASAFANLPEDALTALSRGLRKRQEQAARSAEAAMWTRVRDQVGHLASRLADPEANFKETTVEGTRELITLLPGFNCTGDARVDEVVADIRTMLDGVDARDIRKHAGTRQDVASKAQAITDKLAQWGL